MTNIIYCRNTEKGIHNFYIEANGETHFLFSQSYKTGVRDYFGRGVSIDEAMNFKKANGNTAVIRTMEKLPSYIRYIEREYGMEVLRRTARKNQGHKRKSA